MRGLDRRTSWLCRSFIHAVIAMEEKCLQVGQGLSVPLVGGLILDKPTRSVFPTHKAFCTSPEAELRL